jgi:hypothetical protein
MYRPTRTSSILPQLMIDEVTLGTGLDCKFFVSSQPDVLSTEYWCTSAAGRSEGRPGTDSLRRQLCGVIASGVDVLSVGIPEYSERRRCSFATGLGSEVLTFLFVVCSPRDHAKLHCNKAFKFHLFKMSIACGLDDS